jgi:hypothetical protein
MTEITMPTSAKLVQRAVALEENIQTNTSEWTGSRKSTALPGAQKWLAQFAPHQIFEESAQKEWRGFIIALRGQVNKFRLPMASAQHGGANPTVATGANAGASLPLTGLAISSTVLVIGDFLTVPLPNGHQRLVMLTADLVSNGSGNATAQFRPFLNQVPTLGASVESINPFALMANSESKQGWSEEYGVMTINFNAEEAL